MQHIWTSINLWTIPGHGLPFEAIANRLAVASDWIVASLLSRLPKTKAAPFRKVLLVVLLGSVELLGRQNLCNNRSVHDLLVFLQRFTCCLLLLRCVEVDSGSVLRSHITTLPIADGEMKLLWFLSPYDRTTFRIILNLRKTNIARFFSPE
jgi:hypothetical protein